MFSITNQLGIKFGIIIKKTHIQFLWFFHVVFWSSRLLWIKTLFIIKNYTRLGMSIFSNTDRKWTTWLWKCGGFLSSHIDIQCSHINRSENYCYSFYTSAKSSMCKVWISAAVACSHTEFLSSQQPLLIFQNSVCADNGHRYPSKLEKRKTM